MIKFNIYFSKNIPLNSFTLLLQHLKVRFKKKLFFKSKIGYSEDENIGVIYRKNSIYFSINYNENEQIKWICNYFFNEKYVIGLEIYKGKEFFDDLDEVYDFSKILINSKGEENENKKCS